MALLDVLSGILSAKEFPRSDRLLYEVPASRNTLELCCGIGGHVPHIHPSGYSVVERQHCI